MILYGYLVNKYFAWNSLLCVNFLCVIRCLFIGQLYILTFLWITICVLFLRKSIVSHNLCMVNLRHALMVTSRHTVKDQLAGWIESLLLLRAIDHFVSKCTMTSLFGAGRQNRAVVFFTKTAVTHTLIILQQMKQ